MKIPYFCCIGAELKRYMKDFDFMNQVYLYKVPTDDSIDEVLTQDYFKAISDSVLQDDIVYIYEASENILHECRFDKQDGHITAVPLASDETLTGAVTTIIHDNLTPGKVVISDENGKIAVSETDADELDVLHGLEATTEELNYSHGVTQNIQDQLDSTVHKAGTETITGDKTFTKPISFSMSLTDPVDVISITDTDLHSLITLSCDYASSGMFTDFISHNYSSNYDADLRLFNSDAGSFYLELTGSGNATNLSLSMSETSTSSTVIPTMGWANNPGLNNIVHKTGNESISGNKTFAGTTTFNGATALSTGTITTAPTNNNDITNKDYVDTKVNTAAVPVGAIVSFAVCPAGWLVCDGSAVSRTDYADLFAAIGTTFGPGDGISTFNLPASNERFVVEEQAPTASNNYTWYRLYNDGWVEQGGIDTTSYVTFPVTMRDTKYTVNCGMEIPSSNVGNPTVSYMDKTTNGIRILIRWDGAGTTGERCWQVSGYAASVPTYNKIQCIRY